MLGLLKNYIEKRINLLKLEITENTLKVMSVAVYILLLIFLAVSLFSFLFVSVGLILGNLLGNYAYGFLVVSAFFLLCLLLIFHQKKNIIEFLKNRFVQTIFNEEQDD